MSFARVLCFVCVGSLLVALSAGSIVWPEPQKSAFGTSSVSLDPSSFSIVANISSSIIDDASERYMKIIFPASKVSPRGRAAGVTVSKLSLLIVSDNEDLQLGVSEEYTLDVDTNGAATIVAETVFGALRALETFSQIVEYDWSTSTYAINVAPVMIQDAPRFMWRGLLIDTARHYIPMEYLKKLVDTMSYSKFNTFHWHIVDAQSFPIESKTYPLLSQKGAYAPQAVFTAEEVSDFVDYAKKRGIRVVPEIDTPGHAYCWGLGYPKLTANCPSFSSNVNNIPLNPASDFTYEFLQNFLTEIVPMFEDKFFHIGGDEVVYGCWEEDSNISAFMKSKGWNSTALYQYYHDKQLAILEKIAPKGKMIGWEELYTLGVLEQNDPTTVHVWRDKETLYGATKDGHNAILSDGWYLDKQVPGSLHYEWEDTWIDFYTNEPFDGAPGPFTPEMMDLVLGGEGCMWSEQVDESNMDSRMWPRACAIAERLWSDKSVSDPSAAKPRLMQHRCRLVQRGVGAGPIAPDYCPRFNV
eukprot:TRINITY_DN2232_c0_g1_i1.p1 TRINITY_DN2232_c0_g1~~TRINITY_DN2232_c0_g1_i1.p1  ORF type:complete len:526 (+),score=134.67 TRINITY_DN2232_c0_g1_i1:106-1683(+)